MVAQQASIHGLDDSTLLKAQFASRKVDKKAIRDTVGYVRPRDGLTDQFLLWRTRLARLLLDEGIDVAEAIPQPPSGGHLRRGLVVHK